MADIFKLEGAIANLNASYWQQALSLSDVYEYLPQKRRDEWNDQIMNPLGLKAHRISQYDFNRGSHKRNGKLSRFLILKKILLGKQLYRC